MQVIATGSHEDRAGHRREDDDADRGQAHDEEADPECCHAAESRREAGDHGEEPDDVLRGPVGTGEDHRPARDEYRPTGFGNLLHCYRQRDNYDGGRNFRKRDPYEDRGGKAHRGQEDRPEDQHHGQVPARSVGQPGNLAHHPRGHARV